MISNKFNFWYHQQDTTGHLIYDLKRTKERIKRYELELKGRWKGNEKVENYLDYLYELERFITEELEKRGKVQDD